MAVAHWYVRPVNGDDGAGDGLSHGTAWKTLDHAFQNATYPGAGTHTQFNLCDEGALNITAGMDPAGDWGLSGGTNSFTLRGYTTSANDGGIGTIVGDGLIPTLITYNGSMNYAFFKDLDVSGTSTTAGGYQIRVGNYGGYDNVWFHDGDHATYGGAQTAFVGCRFENLRGWGTGGNGAGPCINCVFIDNHPSPRGGGGYGFLNNLASAVAINCLFILESNDGSPRRCSTGNQNRHHINCTFIDRSGNAGNIGIRFSGYSTVVNCIFFGFSGAGSAAIHMGNDIGQSRFFNNAFYDCTATIGFGTADADNYEDVGTITLVSDPFEDEPTDDFRPAAGTPVVGAGYQSSKNASFWAHGRAVGAGEPVVVSGGGGGAPTIDVGQ